MLPPVPDSPASPDAPPPSAAAFEAPAGPVGAGWAGALDAPEPAPPSAAPARRRSGPPLSSRAVLMVGGLALLCLALVAALAFEAGDDPPPPALDAPAPAPDAALVAPVPDVSGVYATEAAAVPEATLTALERTSAGPIEDELAALLAALDAAFGATSAEIAPALRPYLAHAAGRMSVHPDAFRLVVTAPDAALAGARADVLRRAFEAAGLPADKLTVTARAGPPALTLAR